MYTCTSWQKHVGYTSDSFQTSVILKYNFTGIISGELSAKSVAQGYWTRELEEVHN